MDLVTMFSQQWPQEGKGYKVLVRGQSELIEGLDRTQQFPALDALSGHLGQVSSIHMVAGIQHPPLTSADTMWYTYINAGKIHTLKKKDFISEGGVEII